MSIKSLPFRKLAMMTACIGLLGGCSWLEEWPPLEEKPAQITPEPQMKLVQTPDSTYLQPAPAPAVQSVSTLIPSNEANENAIKRLENLEAQVGSLRQDMAMVVPAVTRLAESQEAMQKMMSQSLGLQAQPLLEPETGAMARESEAAEMAPQPAYLNQKPLPPLPEAGAAPPPPAYAPTPTTFMSAPTPATATPPMAANAAPQTLQTSTAAKPIAPVAVAQPQAAAPVAAPQAQSSGVAIKQIRVGEHSDKTRFVFDLSGNTDFKYDVDNGEKILTLNIPGASYSGAPQARVAQSPIVSGYTVTPDANGVTVAVQLKSAAAVKAAQIIPPSEGYGPRLIVDVAGM